MDGSTNSSDSGFEVHEVIFAESLGVNLQEEFALELLDIATRALYILPEGWEVDFAESELGSIPFFYDSNTEQSHWVHPYAQDLKMLIEEKRLQLLRGEDFFNEEDELEEDESSMYEDAEDISTNRVNESFELEALPSRLKPVDGFPEESEDAQSLSEPMPQISETEEVSEKNEQLDTVEPVEQILQPTVDSNAPDTPNGVSSDKVVAVTVTGPSEETKDVTEDESNAVDTIVPTVQPDEQLEGIGAIESSKALLEDSEAEVAVSSALPEQNAGDSAATIEPPIETTASSESKDPISEQLISSSLEHVEELTAPLQAPVETAADEPTVEAPVDTPAVAVDEALQVVQENVEIIADVVPENAPMDAPDTVQPEATATVEISPVVDSDSSSSSDVVVPAESSVPQAEVEATEPTVVVEESPVVTTELPIEEAVAAPAPAEATAVVVEEATASTPTAAEEPASTAVDTTPPVDATAPVEEAPSAEAVATLDSAPPVEATAPVEEAPSAEAVAVSDSAPPGEATAPIEEAPPVEVVAASDSAPVVAEEPTPEPVVAEEPTPVPAQPATPEKVLPLLLPQATTPPQKAPQEQQQSPTTTIQAQESQSQKSTPKSARPLPVDPFADFFSIDPSLHTFIDTLEKKKKKKAQQKTQGKGKKNFAAAAASASVANDDDVASVDIDEILRRRRQTERVKEEARLKREQEVEAKRLAAEQKKRVTEEETLRAQQEKAERERQERVAEEARRKKEADDAAAAAATAALTVTVPAVTAPSPPSLDRTLTLSDDLAATTKSLFDDLVAKESVPEEEDDDGDAGARLSVSRSVDRFGLSSPVTAVPLDRSIDILDHFRNIYSAGSSANEQPSPIPHAPTSASGTSRTLLRQASVRYVPGVASMAEAHDGVTDSIVHKPRGLDTTKLVTRDPAAKKRKKAAASAAAAASEAIGTTSSSGASPPPKLKPHVTTADGWVVLGAYANYKEAERAVALFEALAPTKSIAGQSFPSHSKFLPPVKGPDAAGATDGTTTMGDGDAVNTSPLKKKSLLASNAPITKESILLSTQQELPQTRIARDLGRMQWLVECNDPSMKKVFERRIAKRLRHGQGAEKLLAHLSPAKQQALGLDGSSSSSPVGGDGKAMDSSSAAMMSSSSSSSASSSKSPLKNVGRKFTAAFTPQALISNKNTKHVSGQMHVQYPLPRVAYDDKKPLPTMMSSLSPTNRSLSNNNNNNNSNNNQHRGPATFRAVLHDAAAAAAAAATVTGGVGSGKSVHSSPGGRRDPTATMHASSMTTRGGGGTMRPASTYT